MARVRDFRPGVLQKYRHPRLEVAWRPGSGFEGRVWQFTIFLPRRFLGGGVQQTICTTRDEDLLESLLEQDFGGCTSLPSFARGIGRRGESFETNLHRLITVLTSRWRGTWRYFKALRKELEECSGEEQILILHQELYVV